MIFFEVSYSHIMWLKRRFISVLKLHYELKSPVTRMFLFTDFTKIFNVIFIPYGLFFYVFLSVVITIASVDYSIYYYKVPFFVLCNAFIPEFSFLIEIIYNLLYFYCIFWHAIASSFTFFRFSKLFCFKYVCCMQHIVRYCFVIRDQISELLTFN